MKTINIMTSCDGNLMKYIPVQLESISANLTNRQINFYLFHDGKNQNFVNKLKKIKYANIVFKDIVVKNIDVYEQIATYGGNWCGAAYYSLCAYEYLPVDMDRILYLDAADILVIGNIDEYYFDDFEDKMLIVTALRYKLKNNQTGLYKTDDIFNGAQPYDKEDLSDGVHFAEVAHGIFNSGSYVINLNKMRQQNSNINNYFDCAKMLYDLKEHIPKDYFKGKTNLGNWGDQVYWGDQGFLSLVFVGDVKYFAYPKIINTVYMPYNFGLWYFNKVIENLFYPISIIHYTGDGAFKPWQAKYNKFLKYFQNKNRLYALDTINPNIAKCYNIWYQYALMAEKRLNQYKIKY